MNNVICLKHTAIHTQLHQIFKRGEIGLNHYFKTQLGSLPNKCNDINVCPLQIS